jgi:hypothetical protein
MRGIVCILRTRSGRVAAMTEPVLVLDRGRGPRRPSLPSGAELVDSVERVRGKARARRRLWLAPRSDDLELIVGSDALRDLRGDHRLVVHDRISRARSDVLRAVFRVVLSTDAEVTLLPQDEVLEVMASAARHDLIIGVAKDPVDVELVILFRGSLEPLVVPGSFLGVNRDVGASTLEPADFGHAIRLGEREASTDGVLYAIDPDFRRRRKALLAEQDSTFGGALRRLRIVRGSARSDFPGLSAKEIARIERGEVARRHRRTLGILARRLGVEPDEIASYQGDQRIRGSQTGWAHPTGGSRDAQARRCGDRQAFDVERRRQTHDH